MNFLQVGVTYPQLLHACTQLHDMRVRERGLKTCRMLILRGFSEVCVVAAAAVATTTTTSSYL